MAHSDRSLMSPISLGVQLLHSWRGSKHHSLIHSDNLHRPTVMNVGKFQCDVISQKAKSTNLGYQLDLVLRNQLSPL